MLDLFLAVLLPLQALSAPVELKAGPRTFRMDPATLKLESVSASGHKLLLSEGQQGLGAPGTPRDTAGGTEWDLPKAGLMVTLVGDGEACVVRLTMDRPGSVTWPVVAPDTNVRALILPRGEGNWVPVTDPAWAEVLDGEGSFTEDFSLPCWGLDLGGQTVTYIVPEPFGADVLYARLNGRLGFRVSRRFTRLETTRIWEVRIAFGGGSPVQPALDYRAWLQARGRFVPMSARIQKVPAGERLPGALHAYLWGLQLEIRDVTRWNSFIKTLSGASSADPASPLGKVWAALPEDGRKAVRNLLKEEWKHDYVKEEVTRALAGLLSSRVLDPAALVAAFPGELAPPDAWGGSISTAFLRELSANGIDRACLVMNDLSSGDSRPDVARLADELGYLCGPYDSYDGVHPPGMKDSWETSQFDAELYAHGGIMRENGTYRPGFNQEGRTLNAAAARPYLERRVRGKIEAVPYNAWFMDCDAYGQYFDDFSPEHPETQAQDCAARVDRMEWISRTFKIPVGSEGGFALAAPAIFYSHGVLTPAIGWGDKDLEDRRSKWYLGTYWPPEAPDVFFKKVPLKAKYRIQAWDPRYRIPLYEAALHDSVVATHHWGTPSLKFKDTEAVTALIEQLYNVPPLYHFTRGTFAKEKARILAHYRFFSPLHRRLALQPLTGFRWLDSGRLVQRTTFGDGTELTANFGGKTWRGDGLEVPPNTIVSVSSGVTTTFSPPSR